MSDDVDAEARRGLAVDHDLQLRQRRLLVDGDVDRARHGLQDVLPPRRRLRRVSSKSLPEDLHHQLAVRAGDLVVDAVDHRLREAHRDAGDARVALAQRGDEVVLASRRRPRRDTACRPTAASMCDGVHGSVPSSLRPSWVTTYDDLRELARRLRAARPAMSLAFWSEMPGGSCTCSQIEPSSSSGRNSLPTVMREHDREHAPRRRRARAPAPAGAGRCGRARVVARREPRRAPGCGTALPRSAVGRERQPRDQRERRPGSRRPARSRRCRPSARTASSRPAGRRTAGGRR